MSAALQWIAFVLVVYQLWSVHRDRLINAWTTCLVACVCLGYVAYANKMWGLFAQQIAIAALAMYALGKMVRSVR